MLKIYRVSDLGQDGTDRYVIGYVTDATGSFAERVALGRGPMGHGNGSIEELVVWESDEDLPQDVLATIRNKETERRNQTLKLAKNKAIELRRLLGDLSQEDQQTVFQELKANDPEDDIPF